MKENLLMLLAALFLLLFVYFFFWQIPKQQLARNRANLTTKEFYELKNSIRGIFAQVLGGMALLIGLLFTWLNLRIFQEGQITDRFTKAITQLGENGSEKLAIRLGGIYALERIAKDSEKDHGPIMEVLTACVRENAPWKEAQLLREDNQPNEKQPAEEYRPPPKPTTDIQAILTVLGRRKRTYGRGENQRLDLSGTDLRWANLEAAHLEGVEFARTHLEGATLKGARLEGARFYKAHLRRADLKEAHLEEVVLAETYLEGADLKEAHLKGAMLLGTHLERADLSGAHLEEALFVGAYLNEANLSGAHLEGANLAASILTQVNFKGAHLEGANLAKALLRGKSFLKGVNMPDAFGLTQEQINSAFTDERTRLLDYLQKPEQEHPRAQ